MRWIFAIVLVVVGGLVAAFGIWTFGRDEDDGDRNLALAYVDVIRNDYPDLRSVELEHVDGTIWRARNHWAGEEPSCVLLDTAKIERVGKQSYEGIERTACPGEVVREASPTTTSKPKPPPTPAPGPGWWTTDEASEKVAHSTWLARSGLGSPLFDCIGQGRRREDRATFEDVYRKFVCTYSYAGSQLDQEGRIVIE